MTLKDSPPLAVSKPGMAVLRERIDKVVQLLFPPRAGRPRQRLIVCFVPTSVAYISVMILSSEAEPEPAGGLQMNIAWMGIR